jgi:hypothetical protein
MTLISRREAPTGVRPQFVGSSTGAPLQSAPVAAEPSEVDSVATEEVGKTVEPGTEDVSDGGSESQAAAAVVGHGGKAMGPEAIAERVERMRRKQLRELFGTDNEEEIKKIVARGNAKGIVISDEQQREFDRLKRLEEVRKRARLTAEQRTQKELEERDKEIETLRTQLKERDTQEAVKQQDQVIQEAAAPFIDAAYMKYARRDLAEYLNELKTSNPEQFGKFGAKQLERWFQKYSTDRPAFAKPGNPVVKEPEATAPPTPSAPTVRKVVTTTKTNARPPAPAVVDGPGVWKGKTVKAGQPNSMNRAELREYAKAHNLKIGY